MTVKTSRSDLRRAMWEKLGKALWPEAERYGPGALNYLSNQLYDKEIEVDILPDERVIVHIGDVENVEICVEHIDSFPSAETVAKVRLLLQ